ncbi:EamA family transporter [Streptomyces sp. A7024]|uniref:EamA family transporter n=1 Tax=Streptomyces coryli TaxID=1128680 RepID=A0A6G4UBY1_9ACTN|nr:EamA family transporter [Streptomyces coryli]NGN69186.1 EamA family transporter [Streptomyces coryli]
MSNTIGTSRIGTVALTALAPLAFGSTFAVTTEFLPPDRPLFTAAMRALPIGLLLLAVVRVLPRGAWWGKAAVLGVLNIGAFFGLLFVGAYRLPGGIAAVLSAVGPLLAIGYAAVLLSERPNVRGVVAGLAGVFGVSLVVLRGDAALDAVGIAAGTGAVASMTLGVVLAKRWGRPEGVGALTFTSWQLVAGGLFLAPLALLVEGAPPAMDGAAIGGYAYLAIFTTAVPYFLWFRGMAQLPATSVAFLGLLSPVSAALIGWVALGQALAPVQIAGMAIALGSTVLGQLRPRTTGPTRLVAAGGTAVRREPIAT